MGLIEHVLGWEALDQAGIDAALRALDGTPDLHRLGANAVLGASVACALAAARARGLPLWQLLALDEAPLLPLPMVNVISGGAHAGRMIDVQDFLVVPVGAASFGEAIEWAGRVRAATAEELRRHGHEVSLVADEGGLAGPLPSNRAALDLLLAAWLADLAVGWRTGQIKVGSTMRRAHGEMEPSPAHRGTAARRRVRRARCARAALVWRAGRRAGERPSLPRAWRSCRREPRCPAGRRAY